MWVNCDLDVLNSIIIITQMCIHQGKLSLGHASLRSMQSTLTRHLPPFLGTTTTLASHSRYFTSLINPTFKRLSTSAWMIWWWFGWKSRTFCRMGLADGRMFNLWEAFTGFISVMSEWFQANTSMFSISACCNRALSSSVKRELT